MNEIMGTTFFEQERWILRHEGGGGNKVPLFGPAEVLSQLKDGGAQVFEGTYSRDHRGVVVSAHIRAFAQSTPATRRTER